MGRFLDILGTTFSKLQIGIGGPQVKNNAGTVEARNAADSAYAAVAALLHKTYGDDFELNSGAAGSGADWKFTIRRPSSGMANAITVIMPSGNPATGQAMTVTSFASNIITLDWTTIAGGADKPVVDTTTLNFGDSSPLSMFTLPANAVVLNEKVIIDTPFNGTPSLSIGKAGTVSKYMAATQIDLTAAAATCFEVSPNLASVGSTEALIATYAQGGASAGSCRILTTYVIPS